MRNLLFVLSLLAGIVFCFPACEVENCPPNALSFANFSLVSQNGNSVKLTIPITIVGQTQADTVRYDTLSDGTIKEVIVYDALINDTLINKESNVSNFSLPLSYGEETKFIISYDGRNEDIITVKHRNIPYFTNLDCGTMMFYQVTELTSTQHQLDSIVTINPNIDNNEKENFRIYFTVSDDE